MGRRNLLVVALVSIVALSWWGVDRFSSPEPGGVTAAEAPRGPAPAPAGPEPELSRDAGESARVATAPVPAAEADAEATAPTHRVSGRVVDERRSPVAGARVELGNPREGTSAATSGPDGRFELLLSIAEDDSRSNESLRARDARGRAALRPLYLIGPRVDERVEVDGGTLVLLAAHSLSVRVLAGDAPTAEARVQVALGHSRYPGGEHRTDADGALELRGLPPGAVYLNARSQGFEGRARVFVPEERAATVELEPLGGVDVLVVDALTGLGVPGAELTVHISQLVPSALPSAPLDRMLGSGESFYQQEWTEPTPRTDAQGCARIEGLAQGVRYRLSVNATGYDPAPGRRGSRLSLEPGGEPVRVELTPRPARRVRIPVIAGEAPVPPEGAPILLRHQPGSGLGSRLRQETPVPGAGRMESSFLVLEGVPGRVAFIAQAPDGSLARLVADEADELGRETAFRRPRRVSVRVHDREGAPVDDVLLYASNQGNNPLCEPVPTNAQGEAVLESLYGGLADIKLIRAGESAYAGRAVGTVDLEKGDGALTVTFDSNPRARARLTLLLDGTPGLPARFQLRGQGRVQVLEEFPERGELLIELEVQEGGSPVRVYLDASGYASAWVDVSLPPGGGEALARLDLESTAVLVAGVTVAKGDYASILPERRDDTTGAWSTPGELGIYGGLSYANGPGGSFVFAGITPGRWRVRDERSGLSSSEALVVAGEREVRVELDLASLEWVTGRVELEDPEQFGRVRVFVEGAADESAQVWRPGSEPPEGVWPRDGEFRLRVPAGREVTLVAWHPWLVPDGQAGRVTLNGGQDGVVLRLVQGDELRLPLTGGSFADGVRVARHADGADPTGEPLAWHHAVVVEGVLRCALPAGRWNLWLDASGKLAPLVLRGVEIAGVTELPAMSFGAGSSLRVRVQSPEGSDPPRIYVYAESLVAPFYHRSINSRGEAEVLLPGLGPGRFRVKMSVIMDHSRTPEQEVELDGESEVSLDFEPR